MSDTTFKVFKYPLAGLQPMQTIEMPRSAQVLEIAVQPHADRVELNLWAMVMPDQPKVERRVAMLATGEEIPTEIVEKFSFVKTFQFLEPRLDNEDNVVPKSVVYHVFVERSTVN